MTDVSELYTFNKTHEGFTVTCMDTHEPEARVCQSLSIWHDADAQGIFQIKDLGDQKYELNLKTTIGVCLTGVYTTHIPMDQIVGSTAFRALMVQLAKAMGVDYQTLLEEAMEADESEPPVWNPNTTNNYNIFRYTTRTGDDIVTFQNIGGPFTALTLSMLVPKGIEDLGYSLIEDFVFDELINVLHNPSKRFTQANVTIKPSSKFVSGTDITCHLCVDKDGLWEPLALLKLTVIGYPSGSTIDVTRITEDAFTYVTGPVEHPASESFRE